MLNTETNIILLFCLTLPHYNTECVVEMANTRKLNPIYETLNQDQPSCVNYDSTIYNIILFFIFAKLFLGIEL